MSSFKFVAKIALATAILAQGVALSHAQLAPIMFADWYIKETTKKAIATPGHTQWCASSKPGYRAKWNNWRTADGRVTYCSSPYFSVPWNPYKG
ncbi:MAG: hypothetical protein R3D34_18140 [Nitratireductor sp.]